MASASVTEILCKPHLLDHAGVFMKLIMKLILILRVRPLVLQFLNLQKIPSVRYDNLVRVLQFKLKGG